MISGCVLYVHDQLVWRAVGRELLKSDDGGRTWVLRAVLPMDGLREWLTVSRLGRRLSRSGYHHFVETGPDSGLIVAHQHIFQLRPDEEVLHRTATLQGSRPLTFCVAEDMVCYGEYRRNSERSSIYIWAASLVGNDWQPIWHFDGIRHVHGVFYDPYISAFWVTTGDDNEEAAIWVTSDRFRTLDRVVGGSQQYRAVQLLFTRDHVFFGSDTPDEVNHIYRLERHTGRVEQLVTVGGSVFYGCKVGEYLFFSTVVEPSLVNTCRYAELWGSEDGEVWKLIARCHRDYFPMKYFQYGQIKFPAGPGDGNNLFFTSIATEHDQMTSIQPVESIRFKEIGTE